MKLLSNEQRADEDLRTNTAITTLVLSALAVLVFTLAGGLLIFSGTRSFLLASEWLEHRQTVLDALQVESARVDRIDLKMQLFQAAGGEETYRSAETLTIALYGDAMRLRELVKDSPSQLSHARTLSTAIEELSRAIDRSKNPAAVTESQLRDCRNVLNTMAAEEHSLLDERSELSREGLVRPLLWGAADLGLSLLVWLILFYILIRDALRRRQIEHRLSQANDALATTVDALGDRIKEAALLKNARDELQLCLSTEHAYDCAARHLGQLVPGSCGALLAINNSRTLMLPAAVWNDRPRLPDGFELQTCCGVRTGRPRWRRPGDSELHCTHFDLDQPENYLCIPLSALGETLGVATVILPDEEVMQLTERRLPLLYEMVELAAMTIAGLNLRARLENQSIRDRLTNLFNRHFLEIALEREIQRAARNGSSMALLMIDVDHFKGFNDRFGHDAGDLILRELAECLRSSVRNEDVVCRYGGEEFVVLLPEITAAKTQQIGETLRAKVEGLRLSYRGKPLLQISVSIGVATFPEPSRDSGELLRMADSAMYQAKKAGRNQVHLFVSE